MGDVSFAELLRLHRDGPIWFLLSQGARRRQPELSLPENVITAHRVKAE
ncbi:MAG: hypothetical protein AAF493_29060 [Pseudomonadota bacterium]